MNRALVIPALALLLAGCSTPVPKALPPQMLPGKFTGPALQDTSDWPQQDWWHGFGYAEMSSLVAAAQTDNRDIAIALARVEQARAQAGVQRSALFPQVGLGADGSNGGCSGQSCSSFSSRGVMGATLNASYTVDFWGLARNNLRAATEQLKSARFGQQAVSLTISANVARQYMARTDARQSCAIWA